MNGIADYEFVRSLGAGSHGEFFLAATPGRVPVDDPYVAVKVLPGDSAQAAFRRAARELQAFAAVKSPHLATLFDTGLHDGTFYYSMEYLSGGSLTEPAEPPGPAAVVQAMAQASSAVAALHAAGILHRNIKPGNVLLTPGGAKLSDPGLSQVLLPGVTITGMGPMTALEYLDPSLLSGSSAAREHDIWGLGVTLHRAVSGASIYGDELPEDDSLLAHRRVLTTAPQISSAIPDQLASIIARCVGPIPGRPSAVGLARQLGEYHRTLAGT